MSGKLVIRNGRVIDPSQQIDREMSIVIEDGKIAAYDQEPTSGDEVIDASGCIVSPGWIDMHVHLREPGQSEDETIETGTAAALAGGFTSIACCPNTDPPIDSPAAVEFVRQKAARADNCRVYVLGCVSKNREGEELSEIGQLVSAGAVGFTDDGAPVYDAELMRRAFEYCNMFGKAVCNHAEVPELVKGGIMHEGEVSLVLGLPGIPEAAESVMVSRDIGLAEATGGRLHVMHVSTAGAVEAVRRGKKRGVRVTAEVTPHHFTLTDECMRAFDANFKMNPPLRSKEHVDAVIEGLKDDTIDAIATDHAPHAKEKKMLELDRAPFGIIGLETAAGLIVMRLIDEHKMPWMQVLAKVTCRPAEILGIEGGTLKIGAPADVTILDPEDRWVVDPAKLKSKASNTPFAGWELKGRVKFTIVGGKVKYRLDG
ncbi:dihydroorotase [Thermostilla marina]